MMRRLAPALLVPLCACGSCEVGTDPIPGGFEPAALIERAAQVRLTSSGIRLLEGEADALVKDAARLSCAGSGDCPAALGSTCVDMECTGAFTAIPVGSGRVFVEIASLTIAQAPPSSLLATISARFASDAFDFGGCSATIDPQGPAAITSELALAPATSGRIGLTVASVSLPALAISGTCDPAAVSAAIEAGALDAVRTLTAIAVGQTCDVDPDCPAAASCLAERCYEGERLLFPGLEDEARISVPAVLESYDTGDAVSDLSIQAGGVVEADPLGVTTGVRGGMELVAPNPRCANVLPSPRLRPSFVAPSPLPATDAADLDYDGVEEAPYQVAFSLSKALIDQAMWSAYGGGIFCGAITTADYDELHTGTLEIIIPSLRFLTKSDLYPRSERPARVSAWLRVEPEIVIGSGETTSSGGTTDYVDPLVHLYLRDFEINLSALIEDRWVRVMTATMDLHLGIAVMITPNNELEPIVGVGVDEIISNIRITNNELLQEDPASIAQALPTLLSFALLEFAGSAGQFPIPTIEGTELDVLGIRGVEGPNGTFDQAVLYANIAITAGNLSSAADTDARLTEVRTPKREDFAVGRLRLPEVDLALGGKGVGALEHQYRVDGGFWTPFTSNPSITIARPEFAIQGHHRIEVRARVKGDYRSLDPTPERIDFVIESEPEAIEAPQETAPAQRFGCTAAEPRDGGLTPLLFLMLLLRRRRS